MPIEMPRGLPFSVDTWTDSSRRKNHHFLTHAHKDHCSAIASFSSSPIYSTLLTKSLLLASFPQLDESLFVAIEVGQSITIHDPNESFSVTAFDANHCPGAVMFLFEGKFGNILHTGDCRLTLECLHKLPERYLGNGGTPPKCRLDYVFLDCTFGKSPLRIPTKDSAIREVINCIWEHPDARVVYLTCDLLGQEELLVNVLRTFGSKIHVDKASHPEYYKALVLIAPEILSEDPSCRFQLFKGFPRLYERAQQKISEAKANMQPEPLIIRPSAQWYACEETELTPVEKKMTEKTNQAVRDHFGVWHVCYSMHSSKQELELALQILAPKWVVSTTPSCRAMELGYVKKHCLISQIASDDPLWKLLDIRVETSSLANMQKESNKSIGEAESQLLEVSSSLKLNAKSSPKKGPVGGVTLFGRARLGFDFCKLYEEKKSSSTKYYSPNLAIDEKEKHLPTIDNNVEGKILDSIENKTNSNVSKVPDVEDILKTQKCSDQLVKVDAVKIQPEGDEETIVCRSMSYTERTSDQMVKEDSAEIQPEVDEERRVCRSMSYTEIIYDQTVKEDSAEIQPEVDEERRVCRFVSYSDNLRMLYRSMNLPVPKPLPSLVELMKANKRARIKK